MTDDIRRSNEGEEGNEARGGPRRVRKRTAEEGRWIREKESIRKREEEEEN